MFSSEPLCQALCRPQANTAMPVCSLSFLFMAAKIMSTAHGHNLSDVFASLELPTQAAIESEFLAASGEQLAPLLAECSDYFIQARYAYEQIGGSYSLSGIRTLAKGLLDAVKAFGIKNP